MKRSVKLIRVFGEYLAVHKSRGYFNMILIILLKTNYLIHYANYQLSIQPGTYATYFWSVGNHDNKIYFKFLQQKEVKYQYKYFSTH